MTDQLDGHRVDAGVARELPQGELGQLAVVALGEVAAHVEDLGRHEMVVVEEPLRRGADELPAVHVLRHGEIGVAQDAGVVVEARQDVARRAPGLRVEREPGREGPRPLFQPLDAQQLVAQGLLGRWRRAVPEKTGKPFQGQGHGRCLHSSIVHSTPALSRNHACATPAPRPRVAHVGLIQCAPESHERQPGRRRSARSGPRLRGAPRRARAIARRGEARPCAVCRARSPGGIASGRRWRRRRSSSRAARALSPSAASRSP